MNTRPTQELLPATHARPADEPNLLRWLIAPEPKRFMLPLTGLWILGLDWLIFTQNILLSLGFATPLAVVTGFVLGTAGTFFIQRRFGRETGAMAALKALLAGIVVGIPFPIAGTAVGAWILLASGLGSLRDRMLKK